MSNYIQYLSFVNDKVSAIYAVWYKLFFSIWVKLFYSTTVAGGFVGNQDSYQGVGIVGPDHAGGRKYNFTNCI